MAFVGHSHHGKTSLLEWMLYDDHVLNKPPSAIHGHVLDSDAAEAARAHSVFSHFCKCVHATHYLLAMTDTPWGDFPADAVASLEGADASVLVISAADSVQAGTMSAWQHVCDLNVPTLLALTKLDRPFLDLEQVLEEIQDSLGVEPLPLQVLQGQGEEEWKVHSLLVLNEEGSLVKNAAVAANVQDMFHTAWTKLEEAVAMTNDDLLVEYLEEGTIRESDVIKGLKSAVLQRKVVPLVYTSAEQNKGVTELMDVMVGVLPSPIDIRDEAIRQACEQEAAKCDVKQPGVEAGFCARVLHTTMTAFGSLSILRVISNDLQKEGDKFASLPQEVVNLRTEEKFKLPSVSTSFTLSGKDKISLQDGVSIVPGDVIAIPKLPETVRANDILSVPQAVEDERSEILWETEAGVFTSLSRPVEDVALMTSATITLSSGSSSSTGTDIDKKHPKHKKGGGAQNDDRLLTALRSLAREDLALRVETDPMSGKLLVHAMSVEHLQLLAFRLEDRYDLHVEFGRPPVPYRETLVKAVKNVEGKHKKQSGGSGQFGVCVIDMEPLEEGVGIEFVSKIKGGVISKPFIASVEKGVREQLQAGGPLGGFPVTDVRVTLVDGKMHSVDSKDVAFQSAGKQAVKAALERGKSRLLQPMELVTFFMDPKWQGDVNTIVSRQDGYVMSSAPASENGAMLEMQAVLPTACLGEVADSLRAASGGEAQFTSEFSHYQPVQDDLVSTIIEGGGEESE
mgnify:CR=1 FL=1